MVARSGIPVLVMRGGAGKCAYFLAGDLPDGVLGLAGRVAVVDRAADPAVDVDCLVVRGADGWAEVLAGAGAVAVERGLVPVRAGVVPVRVRMRFDERAVDAVVHVPIRDERVEYAGDTVISGVPGAGARVLVEFAHGADSVLLPTGRVVDDLGGVPATLIGGGAPVVVVPAAALGVSGYETPARLEYDQSLGARVEALRMKAGAMLGLGDVAGRPEPRMCLVAPPVAGGSLSVRVFEGDRVRAGLDVFPALSLGAAAGLLGGVAARSRRPADEGVPRDVLRLEHPAGFLDVQCEVAGRGGAIRVSRSAIVTTARLLMEGEAFP